MDPSIPRCPTTDPAKQQEAARRVSTAKDLLSGQITEGKIERSYELLSNALCLNPCAAGGHALFVAAIALRATQHWNLPPSGGPRDPYCVLGLDPVPANRDPALIESYYRQASDLLNRCHPSDPCSRTFTDAARIVDDAWAFLSDPDRKAALDSAYDALEAAKNMPKRPTGPAPAAKRQKQPSSDGDDGNSKECAIDLDRCDSFSKFKEETNANSIKVLELQQKLSSEKLETTKLAHLTAQETKEEKKLILEAKKVEKESKMMDAYNNLISQDTSSMSDEERTERVVAMKCLRKTFFPETI